MQKGILSFFYFSFEHYCKDEYVVLVEYEVAYLYYVHGKTKGNFVCNFSCDNGLFSAFCYYCKKWVGG